MSSMPAEVLRESASRAATQAQSVAEVHGYPIPKDVVAAWQCIRELDVIRGSSLPPNQPTTDPKKLRDSLAKIAADARAHAELLQAAADARPLLISRQVQATRAAIPAWSNQLAETWDATWEQFKRVAPNAPREVTQWTSEEASAAYVKALRLADTLDQLLSQRVMLGAGAGEEPPQAGRILYCIGVPIVPSNPNAVEPDWQKYGGLIASWNGGGVLLTTGTRQPLEGRERWEALLRLDGIDISMAPVGNGVLRARINQVHAWQTAIATLHSLGGLAAFKRLDRTGAPVGIG